MVITFEGAEGDAGNPENFTDPRAAERILDDLAAWMKAHAEFEYLILGYANHTQDRADWEREDREELIPYSKRRAEAVRRKLIERGVRAEVLTAEGRGGASPVVPFEERNGWKDNRRVEFIYRKKGGVIKI